MKVLGEDWRPGFVKALIQFWLLDQFPDKVYPPGSEIGKQTKIAKRIAEMCDSCEQGVRAAKGIGLLWPFAPPKGEPWTPQKLLSRFSEAMCAGVERVEISRESELLEELLGD